MLNRRLSFIMADADTDHARRRQMHHRVLAASRTPFYHRRSPLTHSYEDMREGIGRVVIQRSRKRVERLYFRLAEIRKVARYDRQSVDERRGGDQAVPDRHGLSGLAQTGEQLGPT